MQFCLCSHNCKLKTSQWPAEQNKGFLTNFLSALDLVFSPSVILSSQLWLAMQNKGFRHGQSALDFSFFSPHDHRSTLFHPAKLRTSQSLDAKKHFKLLICLWNDPGSLPLDYAHYLNVGNRKAGWGIPVFQLTRLCTDKAMKRGPFWAGHHCSWLLLLSLRGPILYTAHVLLPLPWPNFFWKLCFPNCRKSPGCYKSF